MAYRLISSGTKNAKLGQGLSGRGHVTYFWKFGTSPYLWNGLS